MIFHFNISHRHRLEGLEVKGRGRQEKCIRSPIQQMAHFIGHTQRLRGQGVKVQTGEVYKEPYPPDGTL